MHLWCVTSSPWNNFSLFPATNLFCIPQFLNKSHIRWQRAKSTEKELIDYSLISIFPSGLTCIMLQRIIWNIKSLWGRENQTSVATRSILSVSCAHSVGSPLLSVLQVEQCFISERLSGYSVMDFDSAPRALARDHKDQIDTQNLVYHGLGRWVASCTDSAGCLPGNAAAS